MTGWLKLSDEQRKRTITDVEYEEGIRSKAVEKDWWVTLTLRALFNGKYKNYLLFKGGTSLSKCWKLIHRFSEDIDIAIDPSAFGETYQENPSKSFVKKLRRLGCDFTSNELKKDLEIQLEALGLTKETVEIYAAEVDPTRPDTDPQTLFVKYKSLYDPNPYLEDIVKIEVSTRYLKEPSSTVTIQSLLNEFSPNDAYPEPPFEVMATEAHRTFLEKAFLLHEEFSRPEKKDIRFKRMSRHLYDLVRMAEEGVDKKALEDLNLYKAILTHRKHYSKLSWMTNYDILERDTISFLLPDEILKVYEDDYKTMREEMIYREAPAFDELMKRLKKLNNRFRTIPPEPKIIKVQPEFPPYKFFKNEEEAKYDTWRIDVDEKFKIFRLKNIILDPIEARNVLSLELRIESAADDYTVKINLNNLTYIPRHANHLFFIDKDKENLDLVLPAGRKWITIKVILQSDIEKFEMNLGCDYL